MGEKLSLSKRHIFTNDGLWIHTNVKEGLDHLKEAVDNKWDGVSGIDGLEGSGKSSIAFTGALYLDKNFCLDNVVFNPEQFYEAVDKAKPGTAIVYDEFVTGGLSGDAVTKVTKALTKKMVMIRKKRLYIFLVIPYIFMLTKYFALARTRFLFHCATPDGIQRGFVHIYKSQKKNELYNTARKTYDYNVKEVRPDLYGDFCDFFEYNTPFTAEEYDYKKEQAIISANPEDEGIMLRRYKDALSFSLKFINVIGGFSKSNIARNFNDYFSEYTIYLYLSSDIGNDKLEELRKEIFPPGEL